MKHTKYFKYILEVYAEDDTESRALLGAMERALSHHQWQYQEAPNKDFRNVDNTTRRCGKHIMAILRANGQDILADQLEEALESALVSKLVKTKMLTQAKRTMKEYVLEYSDTTSKRYTEVFAKFMEESFLEHCKEFPLEHAPVGLDYFFEPDWDFMSNR